ncbi:MAG: ComEA family DNA-binding protein, partial [Rudaea sp.]
GSLRPLRPVDSQAAGREVTSSPSAAPAPGVIVVSVTGAVRRPGLVRLIPGSRIADAIDKAGGAAPGADLTGLNLAAKLSDGASVVVSDGTRPATGSASSFSAAGGGSSTDSTGAATVSGRPVGKLDLNTADAAALDALPGVGPVTAANIVAWREKNGHYTAVEQLQEIAGIGPAKFAALAPLVTVQ